MLRRGGTVRLCLLTDPETSIHPLQPPVPWIWLAQTRGVPKVTRGPRPRAARRQDAQDALPAPPARPSLAAHRGPRRTWAARARDSTSPRRHGSSPAPVPPPPSRRDRSPDFSLTAATASLRPALRAGWSAERRPAADWPPRLFVWPHFPPLRPRPLPIGQEKWSRELICQNS